MRCRDYLEDYELATYKSVFCASLKLYCLKILIFLRTIQYSIKHNHGAHKSVRV